MIPHKEPCFSYSYSAPAVLVLDHRAFEYEYDFIEYEYGIKPRCAEQPRCHALGLPFRGSVVVAHQTFCEAWARGPASRCSLGRRTHALATVGLVPTRRNRFGALGIAWPTKPVAFVGHKALERGGLWGLVVVAHQTCCEARARGPASHCSRGRRTHALATVEFVPTRRKRFGALDIADSRPNREQGSCLAPSSNDPS